MLCGWPVQLLAPFLRDVDTTSAFYHFDTLSKSREEEEEEEEPLP